MKEFVLRATPLAIAAAAILPVLAAVATFGDGLAFAGALFAGIALFLGWNWIVGEALNQLIPIAHRPPLLTFRLCIIGCATYAAAFVAAQMGIGPSWMAHYPLIAVVLHVTAALAIVEIARFVATNLTLAEAEADLPPMVPGAMALALSPIAGMPLLQRRIRRLFDTSNRGE